MYVLPESLCTQCAVFTERVRELSGHAGMPRGAATAAAAASGGVEGMAAGAEEMNGLDARTMEEALAGRFFLGC